MNKPKLGEVWKGYTFCVNAGVIVGIKTNLNNELIYSVKVLKGRSCCFRKNETPVRQYHEYDMRDWAKTCYLKVKETE